MNKFTKDELASFIRSMFRILDGEGVAEPGDDAKVEEVCRRISDDEPRTA